MEDKRMESFYEFMEMLKKFMEKFSGCMESVF